MQKMCGDEIVKVSEAMERAMKDFAEAELPATLRIHHDDEVLLVVRTENGDACASGEGFTIYADSVKTMSGLYVHFFFFDRADGVAAGKVSVRSRDVESVALHAGYVETEDGCESKIRKVYYRRWDV